MAEEQEIKSESVVVSETPVVAVTTEITETIENPAVVIVETEVCTLALNCGC